MGWRVKKVIRLIKEDLSRKLSIGEMAQSVNLTPSRLHRLFKAETGMPPTTYLRKLRMEEAKHLLETTTLRVKEIVARVGWSDESHFVRDFKKRYGQTPTQYRARHLSSHLNEGHQKR